MHSVEINSPRQAGAGTNDNPWAGHGQTLYLLPTSVVGPFANGPYDSSLYGEGAGAGKITCGSVGDGGIGVIVGGGPLLITMRSSGLSWPQMNIASAATITSSTAAALIRASRERLRTLAVSRKRPIWRYGVTLDKIRIDNPFELEEMDGCKRR